MQPINKVSILKGDFREEFIKQKVKNMLQSNVADVVAWYNYDLNHPSDASPNKTNSREGDVIRASELAQEAWEFAEEILSNNGHFLCKLFQSIQAGTSKV